MLIINADDWGGWNSATEAALTCFQAGRITSATAMVFMEDSERAASIAVEHGCPIGLHINFNQPFTGSQIPARAREAHERVCRFLRRSRYAQLIYHPGLRNEFRMAFEAQLEEFVRLYGRRPTHFDGHQHMHLCMNSLLDGLIPRGEKVRRSFWFWPGEKSFLNRAYRRWVNGRLERRYAVTDHFFALSLCLSGTRLSRVLDLAKTATVELMTHPEVTEEYEWLLGEAFLKIKNGIPVGDYTMV